MIILIDVKYHSALLSSEDELGSFLIELHNAGHSSVIHKSLHISSRGTFLTLDLGFIELSDGNQITSSVTLKGFNSNNLNVINTLGQLLNLGADSSN